MTPNTDCPTVNQWFTNKAEYLSWRAAWKVLYTKLTEEIKHLKRERSDRDPGVRAGAQWRLTLQFKPKATALLELRKESKLEAQRQYQAAKAALVQA